LNKKGGHLPPFFHFAIIRIMKTLFFAWLGSKRARKQGVADRGSLLDEAARLRLPVPNGGILLDLFYRLLLQDGWLVATENGYRLPDPDGVFNLLYETIHFPRLDSLVLLQSTDADWPLPNTAARRLETVDQLAAALIHSYTLMAGLPDDARRDLLIIPAVPVQTAGSAVAHPPDTPDTVIIAGERAALPQLGRWHRAESAQPPHLRRLQLLLRGVRHAFGSKTPWYIRWVDDGEICWLVQIDRTK
jgi:hypothetical protein